MNRFFSVISSLSKYHVQDFLCCVFQMFKSVLAQFNSKINGPFLFRAVFRHGNSSCLLLQRMAKVDVN